MFCRKCGAQIADDALFCTTCGAPTKDNESADQVKEKAVVVLNNLTPVKHVAQKGKQKYILALIILIIFIAIGTGVVLLNRLTPEEEVLVKQVTEQIDEIGNVTINSGFTINAVEGKYDSLTSKCKRHVKNRKVLKQAKNDWDQLKANEAIEKIDDIGEVTIDSK